MKIALIYFHRALLSRNLLHLMLPKRSSPLLLAVLPHSFLSGKAFPRFTPQMHLRSFVAPSHMACSFVAPKSHCVALRGPPCPLSHSRWPPSQPPSHTPGVSSSAPSHTHMCPSSAPSTLQCVLRRPPSHAPGVSFAAPKYNGVSFVVLRYSLLLLYYYLQHYKHY